MNLNIMGNMQNVLHLSLFFAIILLVHIWICKYLDFYQKKRFRTYRKSLIEKTKKVLQSSNLEYLQKFFGVNLYK